ncbi:hypothetical protein [Pseudomonas sp. UBA6323]|uniref:hypothetical protein n=1 Tax=Pseudomonas sp. UBA6323 TaxID=1947329 RepID=UPI0025F30AD5|nr:hypothetical protein [Pseudomonas sp. UBA6323]
MSHPKINTTALPVQPPPRAIELQQLVVPAAEGQLIGSITLSAHEVFGFTQARDRLDRLQDLLSKSVIPALGGSSHPVAHEITGLIEQVRVHSGNLLWCYSPNNSPEYRSRMQEADL